MRFVSSVVILGIAIGTWPLWLAAQEARKPPPAQDEVALEVRRRLEQMEKLRGPKRELQISPANVVIRIRPPDADPQVDFSYALVSLTLKKPVQGVSEITYWGYSLSDAIALADILQRSPRIEVTVRCPPSGDTSRCWFESFTFR